MIPFAVLVPLSVLGFGLVNKFIDGNMGVMLSLVCLFFNGSGVSGLLHVRYRRRLINGLSYQGEYDFRSLRCVSSRRSAVPKFRSFVSNEVRIFSLH